MPRRNSLLWPAYLEKAQLLGLPTLFQGKRAKTTFLPALRSTLRKPAALHFLFTSLLRHKRYNFPVLLFKSAAYLSRFKNGWQIDGHMTPFFKCCESCR